MLQRLLTPFRPQRIVRRLEELDCLALKQLGLRGVMLDLDNTLAPWRSPDIPPMVAAWVACLHAHGLRGCVVTNSGTPERVRPIAERLGLPWITHAKKPLPSGFRRGMRLLGTLPHETAMIGDLLTMDVIGGNLLGLYTVLVEPMCCRREHLCTKLLQRPLEKVLHRALRATQPR